MIGQHEQICISLARLESLEQDAKDLKRAQALIARLRAENEMLRLEKKRFAGVVEAAKRHISIAGNPMKKYAVCLVKAQLEKARLI